MKLSKEFLKYSLYLDCSKKLEEKIYNYELSKDNNSFVEIVELRYFYDRQMKIIPNTRRLSYQGKHEYKYDEDKIMEGIIKAREEAFGK